MKIDYMYAVFPRTSVKYGDICLSHVADSAIGNRVIANNVPWGRAKTLIVSDVISAVNGLDMPMAYVNPKTLEDLLCDPDGDAIAVIILGKESIQ